MQNDLISRSRLLYSLHREDTRLIGGNHYVRLSAVQEKIMDAALQKAGVAINFREAFPEDRVQEANHEE